MPSSRSEKPVIFLSYRRDDVPGYVGRLSDELESLYGKDRVFRDVDDIRGGTEWKRVIEDALRQSGVLILMVGPRWSDIWRERSGDPVNYVAMELQMAKDHGVPIIPVTLAGGVLDNDLDLGDVDWLRQVQQHDISDRQQRWDHDVKSLLDLIGQYPGMALPQKAKPEIPDSKSSSSKWLILTVLVLLAGLGASRFAVSPDESPSVEKPTPVVTSQPVPSPNPKVTTQRGVTPQPEVASNPLLERLRGIWVAQKSGLEFRFKPTGENSFKVAVTGKGQGVGKTLARMPNKIAFQVKGLGEAELSLSNSEDRMMGWYRKPGASVQNYVTLIKTE